MSAICQPLTHLPNSPTCHAQPMTGPLLTVRCPQHGCFAEMESSMVTYTHSPRVLLFQIVLFFPTFPPPRIWLLPFFLFLILGKGFPIPCPLCPCSALRDLKLHTSVMLQVSFCLFSWQRGFWGLHTQGHCWFKIKDVTQ